MQEPSCQPELKGTEQDLACVRLLLCSSFGRVPAPLQRTPTKRQGIQREHREKYHRAEASYRPIFRSQEAVHIAATYGHLSALEYLLTKRPLLVSHKSAEGFMPLHTASAHSDASTVEYLLSQRADVLGQSVDGQHDQKHKHQRMFSEIP
eukprot:4675349-Amphidinium_carterae.1